MEKKEIKTRDLSIYNYLEMLQKEYFIAYLRHKIYHNEADKKYWARVMGFKKDRIRNLSFRNGLPTIFSDSKMHFDLYKQTVLTKGLPNFLYVDENNRLDLERRDILSYYSRGNECKVYIGDGEFKIGVIKYCQVDDRTVSVQFSDESISIFKFNEVNRIF